jgi:hypothetical protein
MIKIEGNNGEVLEVDFLRKLYPDSKDVIDADFLLPV